MKMKMQLTIAVNFILKTPMKPVQYTPSVMI